MAYIAKRLFFGATAVQFFMNRQIARYEQMVDDLATLLEKRTGEKILYDGYEFTERQAMLGIIVFYGRANLWKKYSPYHQILHLINE
jgi:hypothetical protein